MAFVVNLIYTILILGVLVFVHELGHFMAARSVGLPVVTFSIGMGPALKKWKWKRFGDTEFRISAIPFGGYCMVSGEEEASEEGETFYSKTPWQRIWYASAGVLMNFALAIVVFVFVFAVWGPSYPVYDTNQIGIPLPGNPARKAGVQTQDRILSVDGDYLFSFNQMVDYVNARTGEEIDFLVASSKEQDIEIQVLPDDSVTVNLDEKIRIRDIDLDDATPAYTLMFKDTLVSLEKLVKINGSSPPLTDNRDIDWLKVESAISSGATLEFSETLETRELTIIPKEKIIKDKSVGVIGVSPYTTRKRVGFLKAIKLGFLAIWQMLLALWGFLMGLFKGKTDGVGGPKAIYQIVESSARYGFANILEFGASLSMTLGFLNLVPFPGLDGGHILFSLFEGISGKKINRNVLNTINYVGFMLLMGLMAFVVIRDFFI